jgi:hypothetical protein
MIGRSLALATIASLLMLAGPVAAQQVQSGGPGGGGPAERPPERSLLLDGPEVAAIRKALAVAAATAAAAASGQAGEVQIVVPKEPPFNIYVSAILDPGDGRWTVWANGYRIDPKHQPTGFRVLAVHDNAVEIVAEGDEPIRLQLRPFQTWRAHQRDIVEGIVP